MSPRESGPSSEEMGVKSEGTETHEEREFNEYGRQMQEALADLVVSKANTEDELRQAFADSLVLSRSFDSVIRDTKDLLDLKVVQEVVDELVAKHGLDAEKFSVHRLQELAKEAD